MIIVKCNRCGKERKVEEVIIGHTLLDQKYTIIKVKTQPGEEMKAIHLCDGCVSEFEEWLNKDGEENE